MTNIRYALSVGVNTALNKFVGVDILQLCWIRWHGNNAASSHFWRAKGYQASATDTGTVLFPPCITMYYADFDPIMTSNHDLSVSSFETLHFFLTAQCTLLNLCHIVSCSPTIRRGGGAIVSRANHDTHPSHGAQHNVNQYVVILYSSEHKQK